MKPSPWRKSSRSGGNQGQCVEARTNAGRFELRDSKLADGSPILELSANDWRGFLSTVTR
ncbi:DUF397 domain-containing protein [Phytomonospora endophytica]|uniref:DUF397 domain-containing protein n=1 Tax=Phytomonospora endophytica TaxID=714109 RepID=A0A841G0M9_9ACTN|nr:DUF397 domain-containing protein [Phytomonospora endophytica]MBB6039332.1 hypothetical protein [Phytomonospora endophytica]GIG69726.1 hypothetical protein Pen01_60210 [Phytomonospora endophytica]